MAHEGADLTARLQELLRLSHELKELSDQVQFRVNDGSRMSMDLLARNRELVRRCDQLASEMSEH